MSADFSITGLILSGGLSTRMGGIDKGLIGLNNQPMIAHIINKLKNKLGKYLLVQITTKLTMEVLDTLWSRIFVIILQDH